MGGYMPSTRSERAEMLRAIGLDRPEELFASVPEGLRVKKLDLAPGLSELALSREMRGVAAKNRVYRSIFRGAGRVPPLHTRRGRRGDFQGDVRHRLHALSGGDEPGRAAVHL